MPRLRSAEPAIRSRGAVHVLVRRWLVAVVGLWAAIHGVSAASNGAEPARPTAFVPIARIGSGWETLRQGDPIPEDAAWVAANELVVRVRPGVRARGAPLGADWTGRWKWLTAKPQLAKAGRRGIEVLQEFALVQLEAGTDLATAIAALERRPDVLYAEPNVRMILAVEQGREQATPPSDFQFLHQWALHNTGQTGGKPGADVGALEAWAVSTGSKSVVAAIIDTGLDFYHPDLEPNVWRNPGEVPGNGVDDDSNGYIDDVHGFDFVSDDGDPMDDNVHGTHVGGILGAAGNDENGIAGMAWQVRLIALKAFDEAGSGTLDDTLAAIGYAVSAGVRIINASWGTTTRSRALDDAVTAAVEDGVVFVAAAGNLGNDTGFYPAAVPAALAVGATDARDEVATFSNYGAFVDLVAPGDAIESTSPNAAWLTLSGTSMAAPHVSGAAALLLALRPDFRPAEIATLLQSSADEIESQRFSGAGRLNAGRALHIGQPLPDAAIDMAPEVSGVVDVTGRAGGHGFRGYRLEVGAGRRPREWIELVASGLEASGGRLMEGWDTTTLDDGAHTLRLSVSNALGQAAVVRMTVTVRNVQILDPLSNDVRRRGEVLPVIGTSAGNGREFVLDWGYGASPREWQTNGLVLTAQGRGPVVQGELALWDTASVGSNAFVTLRLTAYREGRSVGVAHSRLIHFDDRLRQGWPVALDYTDEFSPAHWREFTLADLQGDGRQEVVVVDHGEPSGRSPRLLVLGEDGRVRWSRALPGGAPEYDAPVAGDLDGDGRLEIVVDTGSAGAIAAFNADGMPLGDGWPAVPGGTHFGKLIVDLDGDGRSEVVALSNPPSDLVSQRQRLLVVLESNGRVWRRWTLPGCEESVELPELLPAVVNLDEDDTLEIVAADGCGGLSAFDVNASEGPLWTALLQANVLASPVVGDLDGDGQEEVVVAVARRGKGQPGGLHVLDREGNPSPGWPVLTESSFELGPALADLDGDGTLEMVISDSDAQTIHVVRWDGFELPGWPIPYQANVRLRSQPAVGDVDGDGQPDVVLATGGFSLVMVLTGDESKSGGIRAWRQDGSILPFHPGRPGMGLVMDVGDASLGQRLPGLALGDLDGNGKLDVIAATRVDAAASPTAPLFTLKMRSSLYAWELDVPWAGADRAWPMPQRGPQRTGRFVRSIPPNQAPSVGQIPNQKVAVGSPFRPVPLDRYVADPDDALPTLVWTALGTGVLTARVNPERVLEISPPDTTWEGSEELELRVTDPAGASDSVRLTFSAVAGYRPPVAGTDLIETLEDTAVDVWPLENDVSPTGRPLRIAGVSRAGAGEVELRPEGLLRYLPSADFAGEDVIEYTVMDDDGGLAVGEVRIRVAGVNDPPRPEPDRLITDEDTSVDFDPVGNDRDPDGEPVMLVSMETPARGTIEPLGLGQYRFQPEPDYFGTELIPYLVRDAAGLTATGEVAVLVKPVNDSPRVRNQTVRLNRNRASDIFYDAADADGDTLQFTIMEGPQHGVLLAYPGIANFEPERGFAGTDQFTYSVSDGFSTVGPATVTLVVEAINNPPDVEPVTTVTAVDQPLTIGLHAMDSDGDPITLLIERPPKAGHVDLAGTNSVYTPAPGFVGTDDFVYRALDGESASLTAQVTIRVTDENTAPVGLSEVLTVPRNRASPIRLQATDAENNPLQFEVVTNTVFGPLEGEAPDLIYQPASGFRGLDRLWFVARDRQATSAVTVVHLLVRDPNAVAVVSNQVLTVVRDQPLAFRLDARDSDGQALQAVILKGPRSGRVHGLGTDYTYVPDPGFQGRDAFTYRVWDGLAYSAVATVSLVVEQSQPVRLEFTGARVTDEGLEITVRTAQGLAVRFEVSADLRTWEWLGSVDASTGIARWVDPVWDGHESRFYRASVAP